MSMFCSCLNDHSHVKYSSIHEGAITNIYHAQVSTQRKPLLIISLTWSNTLSIAMNTNPVVVTNSTTTQGETSFPLNTTTTIAVFWDYSAAKYDSSSPEPVSNFYVAIAVGAEFVLLLGDKSKKLVRSYKGMIDNATAQSALAISRTVQVVGGAVMHSTKARFGGDGTEHDVVVRLEGESAVVVCVDEKEVVCVRRLRWNFRGVETVFVDDGVAVDVMWDLYEWLFRSPPGCAVVLLRRRGSELGCRLWLEEGWKGRSTEEEGILIQVFEHLF